MLGPFVKIISGNHVLDYRFGPMNAAPPKSRGHDRGILIESDVWIGAAAIILDGAKLSEGSVIGAGSVINRYTPPYCIATGSFQNKFKARFSRAALSELLLNKQSSLAINEVDDVYARLHIEYRNN